MYFVYRLLAVCANLLFIALTGCAWTIHPPVTVDEPVSIFVTDYGRHTRVALPGGDRQLVEYGFGDWEYYGLEETDTLTGLRAITGFGDAAISRRQLPHTANAAEFLAIGGGSRSEELQVNADRAAALYQRLETEWRVVEKSAIPRRREGLLISKDSSQQYHLFRNSNHITATRLKELGCDVRGIPILSNFRVDRSRVRQTLEAPPTQ